MNVIKIVIILHDRVDGAFLEKLDSVGPSLPLLDLRLQERLRVVLPCGSVRWFLHLLGRAAEIVKLADPEAFHLLEVRALSLQPPGLLSLRLPCILHLSQWLCHL
jgi:hypothetical protein